MQEIRNEKGEVELMVSDNSPVDKVPETPPAQLGYFRPSRHARRFPAEIYLKVNDTDFYCVGINRNQLQNMLVEGQKLLREFDKRTPEDTEVE